MSLSFRSRLEHASVPLVERLNRVPRAVPVLVLVALLAAGILAPVPWGGIAFIGIAVFIGWLIFLTWQRLNLPERLMRFAVLALVLAVAVVRLIPKG